MLSRILFAGSIVIILAVLLYGLRWILPRVQVARANIKIREAHLKEASEELLQEIRKNLAAVSPHEAKLLKLDHQLRCSKEKNPWWRLIRERDTVAIYFVLVTADSLEKFEQETLSIALLAGDKFLKKNPAWRVTQYSRITRPNTNPNKEAPCPQL